MGISIRDLGILGFWEKDMDGAGLGGCWELGFRLGLDLIADDGFWQEKGTVVMVAEWVDEIRGRQAFSRRPDLSYDTNLVQPPEPLIVM